MNTTSPTRTLAMALMTIATAVGFVRVFDSASFLGPLVAVAVLAHLTAAVTRDRRPGRAMVTMTVVGLLVCIDLTNWTATTFGVPTRSTFTVLGQNLSTTVETLRTNSAPVTPDAGMLLIVAAGLWIAAWSADRLTFRYDAPVEAIVPAATIFVIVTALAGPDHRWLSVALFAGAVALHLLAERHLTGHPVHPTRTAGDAWRPVLRGSAMAGVAILAGLTLTATVPALQISGIRPVNPDRSIVVESPLIDIRQRLVDQSDVEMFRVTAAEPHYWRQMALDRFDGTRWLPSNSQVRSADGDLGSRNDPHPTVERSARFELLGLGGSFAPTAFKTTRLGMVSRGRESLGTDALLWDDVDGTLVASRELGGVAGLSYSVEAAVPAVTADDIEAVGDSDTVPDGSDYSDLPDDFPDDVRDLARHTVEAADAHTRYDKAMALMAFFDPDNGFSYTTEIPQRPDEESTDAIVAFLEDKRGFCVQFAGTYAAMARAVDLPTRVAVGFTWGDAQARSDGTFDFTVTGRHAHAWPEVYLGHDLGWLPFDPTPGRGSPDASEYTHRLPDQEDLGAPPAPAQQPAPTTATPTDPADPAETPSATTVTTPTGPATTSMAAPPSKPGPPLAPLLIGIALLVLALSGPTIRRFRHDRRLRNADEPARRVRLAWTDTLDAWHRLDLVRSPVDTDRDLGDRLADRIATLLGPHAPSGRARRLAELATAAAWNADGLTADDVKRADDDAEALRRIARDHRSRTSRMLGWFDPRYRGGR